MTTPEHLGGDRWRVRVYVGRIDGRDKYVSRSFRADGPRAANRAAPTIVADIRAEVDAQAERVGTIAELGDDWLAMKVRQDRSPVTIDGYRAIVQRITDRWGRRQVADLTGRDIDRWYQELADDGVGAPTIDHYHSVLRAMLRQAVKWRLVDYAVTEHATPPRARAPEIHPPTPSALADAIASLPASDFRRMIELAALTGMRRGELCGLWWSDIEGLAVTVRRSVVEPQGGGWLWKGTKTGKARTFPLGPTAIAVLDEQRRYIDDMAARVQLDPAAVVPVFADLIADATGMTPRRPGWLSHEWMALRDAAGLDGARLHDLRHLNVTAMLAAGVPVGSASRRAGHSKTSTTLDIYTHETDAGALIALEAVEGTIGSALRPRPEPEGAQP